MVKNHTANAGDGEDANSTSGPGKLLEEGMATGSNILAWRIPRTEERGGL